MKNKLSEIVVEFITHGSQAGAQVHEDTGAGIWTVFTQQGLERTYSDAIAYARFMTSGI